jgi:benzylsuccinate CoA-transferase BbsF subunit
MGAEVIKVQEVRPTASDQRRLQGQGGGGAALNSYWLTLEGNKRFIALDYEQPKGKEVFKRLIAKSDILIENHRPVVFERAGLDYESLRQINPGLIMVSITYAGHTGPERNYAGYGHGIDGLASIAFHNGYHDDDHPMRSGVAYADTPVGMHTAAAIMMALRHRRRTGEGQYVDVSLREGVLAQLAELFMEYAINKRFYPRFGNREFGFAPSGCFPCLGDDHWITITVKTDDEWVALRRVMGDPEWARDTRFYHSLTRWSHHDELDSRISQWTRDKDSWALAEELQTAGIAATAVASVTDVLNSSPHHIARQFWGRVSLPELGAYHAQGPAWHLSKTPARRPSAPVSYGHDNDEVFLRTLGISEEEYRTLQDEHVISSEPVS